MSISVIIPTYNAQQYLPELLASLDNQTIEFELIIIDSSSTDETLALVKPYTQNIITITKDEFDHGGTRTKAAKIASGEYLIFLTQDAIAYDKNTLKTLLDPFKDPAIVAVYGRQIPHENTSLFGKHLRYFNYASTSHIRTLADKEKYGIKTTFFSDSFAAYRKSALQEVNWFKNGLIVGEDMHVIAKLFLANHKIAYCAKAKVYHSHSYTLKDEFKRYFDTGVFHTQESWILETFGKAEGEGIKYLKSEFNYLLQHHAYYRIPEFMLRTGLKYIGYTLGKKYQHLPISMIKKLSLHQQWWEKYSQ
ncbi:MAG: glycosyltransferase family 2 protein [Sulfurovum sp.]|nr:MAG: glycosyltransferase family 2 protein [Sulfurovum sp.]